MHAAVLGQESKVGDPAEGGRPVDRDTTTGRAGACTYVTRPTHGIASFGIIFIRLSLASFVIDTHAYQSKILARSMLMLYKLMTDVLDLQQIR